jgi:hypothetical protein
VAAAGKSRRGAGVAGVVARLHQPVEPATPPPGRRVVFELVKVVPVPPDVVWQRLTDWPRHAEWIPATRVAVDPEHPDRFVAWTGFGPASLEDRMQADELHFEAGHGRGHVTKLGPVLGGEAVFSVAPGLAPGSTVVHWREDITVPFLPRILAPVAGFVGRATFGLALRRLARRR